MRALLIITSLLIISSVLGSNALKSKRIVKNHPRHDNLERGIFNTRLDHFRPRDERNARFVSVFFKEVIS